MSAGHYILMTICIACAIRLFPDTHQGSEASKILATAIMAWLIVAAISVMQS